MFGKSRQRYFVIILIFLQSLTKNTSSRVLHVVEKCVGYFKFTGNKPSDSISFDKCFSIKILLFKSPGRITSEYFNERVDNNSISSEYSVVLCGL